MRSVRPLPALLLALLVAPACSSPAGDDSGGDDPTDDTGGSPGLVEGYEHTLGMHIVPNETGALFGLTECDVQIGASVDLVPDAAACPSCEGLYRGLITSTITDCSGVSFKSDSVEYGLAWASPGLLVATLDAETQQWTDEGVAAPLGAGAYELVVTELMGDESFNIGESTTAYRFEER